MFRWKKLGLVFNPLEVSGVPWLKEFAQAPCVLIKDRVVRVYFSCRPPKDQNDQYVSYSAYVDLNRSNLFDIVALGEKPIFELGSPGMFDEFGTYPTSVTRDDNGQVVAFYAGWTRCESVPFNVAIGGAISGDDGTTFTKLGPGPILGYSQDEPFILSGPKVRRFEGKWQLWYIAGKRWILDGSRPEPVYHIRMATSEDGRNWVKLGKDLIPTRLEENECQASPDVFYSNGRYHMFFCYRYGVGYRGREKGYRIGYAVSDDMLNWTRADDKAGIDVSEEGWDSEMISYPHVFEIDGRVFMLYLGNQVGRGGFGLAELEGSL